MKSTTRRLGRKIIVDGSKYFYKIHVADYDYNSHEDISFFSVDIRNATGRIISQGCPFLNKEGNYIKPGDKVEITPKMIADYIRENT